MDKRFGSKTLALKTREIVCVARTENLIAGIPVAILVKPPVVDVPLAIVGVPVDVHREHSVPQTIRATTL